MVFDTGSPDKAPEARETEFIVINEHFRGKDNAANRDSLGEQIYGHLRLYQDLGVRYLQAAERPARPVRAEAAAPKVANGYAKTEAAVAVAPSGSPTPAQSPKSPSPLAPTPAPAKREIRIEPSWKNVLQDEFAKEYFEKLSQFIHTEYKAGAVYPAPKNIFRAFDLCPFDKVKVVILGQDPYHGAGQANGLSFAVESGVRLPPSLQNMFKEISTDLGVTPTPDGDLSRWAKQGVLLLNATLTVRANAAGSHQNQGWETFTDMVIRELSGRREKIVFLLWGGYARKKGTVINQQRHFVLEAAHPSPLSAHNGFFGCKHFSKANDYLRKSGCGEIDWR